MRKIKLAISTCPNDTFAFHALLERKVDWQGIEFEVQLLDIQQLNDGLFRGEFNVAKASFHAAVLLADKMEVLPSGSAIGFGVGPLLLASQPGTAPSKKSVTLCPGQHTTATLLFRMFYGVATEVKHVLFSEIMPQLVAAQADFGVCIHEGRFTWQEQNLHRVADLGQRWESETQCPLPLGGILASKQLGNELTKKIQTVVQDSIDYGLAHPDECLPTMRKYAQEFSDEVLMKHVELYVNDWTRELGKVGTDALNNFSELAARALGLEHSCRLSVWNGS